MSGATFEFRVLTGVHEGALVTLPGDDLSASWTVGRSEEADIILSDMPCDQVLLALHDGGWRWQDPAGDTELTWGEALRMAGLCLQCSQPDGPRPTPQELQALPDRHTDSGQQVVATVEGAGEPMALAAGSDAQCDTQGEALPVNTAPVRHIWRRRPRRLRTWGLVVATGMVMLWLMGALSQVFQGEALPQEARSAPSLEVAIDPVVALNGVRQELVEAGLAWRIRALPLPQGRIRLLGVIGTDDAMDDLLHRLSPWMPLVSLELLTHAEFARNVAALAPRWPHLHLSANKDGRVIVEGQGSADLDPATLAELIAQALPEASGVGLDGLRTALPPEAQAVQALEDRPSLPSVAAVVSGERAYVLLADGRRLLPGAQVRKGLTLARIDDASVIFETATGQTFAMNRGIP